MAFERKLAGLTLLWGSILNELNDNPNGLGVVELGRALGVDYGSIRYGLLSLLAEGLVERGPEYSRKSHVITERGKERLRKFRKEKANA